MSRLMILNYVCVSERAFVSLGVVFDLRECKAQSKIWIANKTERVKEIKLSMSKVVEAGALSGHQASSLRGRLIFASAQCFGRAGAWGVKELGRLADHPGKHQVDQRARVMFHFWQALLDRSPPRLLSAGPGPPPVLLFTDGACEGEEAAGVTMGGVVFDPLTQLFQCFGCPVPEAFVQILSELWAENFFAISLKRDW